MKRDFW